MTAKSIRYAPEMLNDLETIKKEKQHVTLSETARYIMKLGLDAYGLSRKNTVGDHIHAIKDHSRSNSETNNG